MAVGCEMDEGNEYNCEMAVACERVSYEDSEKDAEARISIYIPVL